MFSIGIPVLCTLLSLYVAWRATSVGAITRRVPRPYVIGISGLLWAVCLLGHGASGRFYGALELVGMSWLATLLLLAVCLLAVELVTGFGLLLRRRVSLLRGVALFSGTVLSVVALVQGLRAPVVTRYEVALPGLPSKLDGTVVVALSDLHLGNLLGTRWLRARIDQINAQRPQLVLLLGDILEHNHPPAAALRAELGRLRAPLGLWAVSGNHELHHGRSERLRPLQQAGVRLLRDQWQQVRQGLVLAGVDDLTQRRRAGQLAGRVRQALAKRPRGA